MVRRVQALFMLLLLCLALPAGAGPHRLCTRGFIPAAGADACRECRTSPCCGEHPGKDDPDCVVVTRQLPDGTHPDGVSLPSPAAFLLPPEPAVPGPPVCGAAPAPIPRPMRDRAPPDPLPLYLVKRSLLL